MHATVDELTSKEAIITIATMMSLCKPNHQAKPLFRGKLPSLNRLVEIISIVHLNISCDIYEWKEQFICFIKLQLSKLLFCKKSIKVFL